MLRSPRAKNMAGKRYHLNDSKNTFDLGYYKIYVTFIDNDGKHCI